MILVFNSVFRRTIDCVFVCATWKITSCDASSHSNKDSLFDSDVLVCLTYVHQVDISSLARRTWLPKSTFVFCLLAIAARFVSSNVLGW